MYDSTYVRIYYPQGVYMHVHTYNVNNKIIGRTQTILNKLKHMYLLKQQPEVIIYNKVRIFNVHLFIFMSLYFIINDN